MGLVMRVISKSRLVHFWQRTGCEDSEEPLKAWYAHVSDRRSDWQNWADVKASFRSADTVGNCVVFNIAGNKYRLIARIIYQSHKVYVLEIMSHKEYDKGNWKTTCGCFSAPPKKKPQQQIKRVSKRIKKWP